MVTKCVDYGCFIRIKNPKTNELEEGLEGLVHQSELSWTKKNIQPSKVLSPSQEIEVKIIENPEDYTQITIINNSDIIKNQDLQNNKNNEIILEGFRNNEDQLYDVPLVELKTTTKVNVKLNVNKNVDFDVGFDFDFNFIRNA